RESGQIVVADRVKIALANDVHSGAIAWNQVADRPINLLPKKVRPRAGGLGTAVQVARPCAANHDLAVAVDLRCGMWVRGHLIGWRGGGSARGWFWGRRPCGSSLSGVRLILLHVHDQATNDENAAQERGHDPAASARFNPSAYLPDDGHAEECEAGDH